MGIRLFASAKEAEAKVPVGTMKLLLVRGQSFNLIHAEAGFVATNDSCPHMNEPLHKGSMNAFNEVICPLHHYRFNLITGQESINRCQDLKIYPVNITPDGVFLEI